MKLEYATRLQSNRSIISAAYANTVQLSSSVIDSREQVYLARACNNLEDALRNVDSALAEGK